MTPDPPGDDSYYYRDDQEDGSAAAYPLHQQRQTLAKKVAQRRNYDRPQQGAGNVVNKEHAPAHLRGARKQGREHPQSGNETRDENCLITMALEIILHAFKALRRQKNETAEA